MATLAEKLQKAVNSKNALKTVLVNKGAAITDSTLFSDYATLALAIDTTPSFTNDECLIKQDGAVTKVTKQSLITSNDASITASAKQAKVTELVEALDDSHVYAKNNAELVLIAKDSITEGILKVSDYINDTHNIAYKNESIISDNITENDAIIISGTTISKVLKSSLIPTTVISSVIVNTDGTATVTINEQEYSVTSDKVTIAD